VKRLLRWLAILTVVGGLLVAAVIWWRREPAIPERPPPPAAGTPAAYSGELPNVVLVIGCTVRRDQVTPYGGHPATTPFLSELAEHGVRFTDAISAAPWTRPAATAILTGHPFREVGMYEPATQGSSRKLADAVTTLAEIFDGAGYFTVGATSNPNLNRVFGLAQGFERYHESTELWRTGMKKVEGEIVVDRLLPVLDQRAPADAPVFVQLMLLDAHHPRRADRDSFSEFGVDVPREMTVYRAYLNRFDRAVRRLWVGLNERGFDDSNTLFVVVSDHGEGLHIPSNQGKAHGIFLVPGVLDMVWLTRGRGVASGVTVDGLASQIDVLPTLLGLTGLEAPDLPGRDWSDHLRQGGRTDRTRAFTETDFNRAEKSAIFSDERACEVRDKDGARTVGCFDRKADPYHVTPLPQPDVGLLGELDTWREEQAAAAEAWPWTEDAFPTREERLMLEQLGYVE
jgi:arylsulfatase A-like enzyme